MTSVVAPGTYMWSFVYDDLGGGFRYLHVGFCV